jgi:hypothetical protein
MTDILKDAMNACFFQAGLEADDPRRVDLHALGVRGTGQDPVYRMQTVIDTADRPTQQLFSGFIGSGKSTELKRLAANLKAAGYSALLTDCEEYLNLNVPPRVNDLLAVVATGVDAFIQDKCRGSIREGFKTYWERFHNFLGSEVQLEGITLKVPAAGELKLKVQQDVTFRTKLYAHLEQYGRLSDLAKECHDFLDEAKGILAEACPDDKGLVIIVDSFEKVRGDFRHAEEVRDAVETIFIRDWKWLCLPFHVIYTVPPWLTFFEFGTAAEFGRVCILPMCRLTDQNSGKRVAAGFAAMREILEKRMVIKDLFEDPGPLHNLIEASGGYPRDFLRMMHEVLLRAIMDKVRPPIPSAALSRILAEVVRDQIQDYSKPVFDEDLPMLVEVAQLHDVPRKERSQVFRIAELFDHHFILGYCNGQEWYDLHPLVRRSPKVDAALRRAHENKPELPD